MRKRWNPGSSLQSFQHHPAAAQNSLSSPHFVPLLAFLSITAATRGQLWWPPINTISLTLLHRKTGESSYWSGLEPLFPVFHTDSDYFWETAALQRGSAVLGSLAWWLLLDTLHDGGGFPGVLHSSDHYQVSQQACGKSCQECNQHNALISTRSLQFHFHTCLIAASLFHRLTHRSLYLPWVFFHVVLIARNIFSEKNLNL